MNRILDQKIAVFTLLFFLSILRCFALYACNIPLYGDEAQYWLWSQNLDFGYFSKPPMVAAVIRATTELLGNDAWAVRIASPILHLLTAIVIFCIGKKLFNERTGLASAIIYSFIPGTFLSSALISTDPILLFIWALALLIFINALEEDKLQFWIALGVISGLGLMTKYNMGIFGIAAFLFLILSKYDSHHFRSYKIYLTGVIAFAIWLPNLIWNYNHEFVSFIHTADLAGSKVAKTLHPENLAKFLSEQFLLFGPLLLIAFLCYCKNAFKNRKTILVEEKYLLVFSLTFLLIISLLALKSRAHGNWAAPAYIGISILTAKYIVERNKQWVITVSAILHTIVILIAFNYEASLGLIGKKLEYSNDIFRRIRSNEETAFSILEVVKKHPNAAIASQDRLLLATLKYYLRNEHLVIQKLNPNAHAEDYFDMIHQKHAFAGKTILVIDAHHSSDHLVLNGIKPFKIQAINYSKYTLPKPYNVFIIKK